MQERLAACTHVHPTTSQYEWNGLQKQDEWVLEWRTTKARAKAARKAVLADHPYEVPLAEEWTVRGVPVRYAAWATQVTSDAQPTSTARHEERTA